MSLHADISGFVKVFNEYIPTTKKTVAVALTERARNIAFKAAAATPIESAAVIRSDLKRDPHLLAALTSIRLRKAGKGIVKAPEFKEEMQRLLSGRIASSRFLRAGWAQAIIDLGGSFRGSRKKPSGAQRTSHSYGIKATFVRLLSQISWIVDEPNGAKAESAERIASAALKIGIEGETQKLADHIADKLSRAYR